MGQRQRIVLLGLAVLVVAVAVVIAVSSSGGDDDVIDTRTVATQAAPATTETTAEPEIPTVVVKDGEPVGGVQKLRYRKGGDIVFIVESDTAAEIHLHGYDVAKEVEAGGSVRFDVPAKIDGRFEVELEETATQIAAVEVVP
jgi:hypothetical protein